MKIILSLLTLIGSLIGPAAAQDVITFRNGDEIQAKVTQVGLSEVKYHRYDNLDGPEYSASRSEVIMIAYANGTKDIFDDIEYYVPSPTEPVNTDLYARGELDATRYYEGYRTASVSTLAVGLIFPLAGLVPAIACSSTPPKPHNLNYPDAMLIKDAAYLEGYSKRARKIKKTKVWTNLGIATGVNIVVFLMLGGAQ
ncbi:MAG: hypothetical protein M3R08_02995 [Bacteroidota bacterium]|nr:hypothetical protein [Bacteroidota bacterium]